MISVREMSGRGANVCQSRRLVEAPAPCVRLITAATETARVGRTGQPPGRPPTSPPRPAPRRTAPLDWKKRASTSRFQQQPSHRPACAPLISLAAWTTCSQRMNWSELNWTELTRSYTTRSLVTRVSVTPWLAAAKLGRLVLGEFWTDAFQCGYSHWSLQTGGQFSL